jgi:high-affinity iron transporter
VARRWLFALTLLAGLPWASLGVARAAEDPNADPLAQYIALIDHVRADLTSSLESYRVGDATKALQLARSAYLDSFELVEFPLRDRDPDLTLEMEDAFAVLRTNIRAGLPVDQITDNVSRLQNGMDDVERTLSLEGYAPLVVATTSFVIIVRGGTEVLLLVSSIFAYLASSRATRQGRAVLWGMAAAGVATIATWFALDTIIRIAPVRPAIVQALPALIAVIVLVAFSAWLLSRLDQRRYLEFMSAKVFTALATGSTVALVQLGFTAVYRPGIEAVAFYQGLLAYTRGLEGWLVVGAVAGAVAVGAIALAMFRLGRRVPLTAFLGVSVVIVMAISVAFLGNAVRSLQEGYVVGITNLTGSLPRLPIYLAQATGYHPTLETIVAQLLLIAAYVVAAGWVFAVARRRSRRIPRLAEASTTP